MNGLEMRDATLALNPASLPKRLIRIFVGGIAGRYIEILIGRRSHLGVQYFGKKLLCEISPPFSC